MIYRWELYLSTRPSLQKGLSRLKSRWRFVVKGSQFRLSNELCYYLGTTSFFGRGLSDLTHELDSNFVERWRE